jgi:prevent-host-death family protein
MKTATVRDLRNHYSGLMKWIEAGEEVRITRRGKAIARLVPEPLVSSKQVDWSQSPAVLRERRASEQMSAATARKLLDESAGQW